MKSSLCLLLAGAVPSGTWGTSIRGVQPTQVKPKLDPAADAVFRKDYVHDLDPKGQAGIKFHHPYPMVQDTSDFDKDYPKDENYDDGEWKAQMEYDLLRTKVAKEKDDFEKAKAAEAATAKELEEARKAEEAAAKAAADAAERAKQAQEDAANKKAAADEKAKAKADADAASAAGGKDGAGGSGGQDSADGSGSEDPEVKAAVDKVKKEMEDLEKCQKELADARQKLKELMDKKKNDDENHQKEEETKLKSDAEKRTQESEKANADANAASAKALAEDAELAKKRAEDATRKRKLAEEQAMHAKAEDALHTEEMDMQALEKDISKAADRLRKYRKDVDSSGGVYRTQEETPAPPVKSNASTRSVGFTLVAAILAVFLQ